MQQKEAEVKVPKLISRARQLRFEMQIREGRDIPVVEVAKKAGLDRRAVSRMEDDPDRFDGDVVAKLCTFYGVGVEKLLVLSLEEDTKTPEGL